MRIQFAAYAEPGTLQSLGTTRGGSLTAGIMLLRRPVAP